MKLTISPMGCLSSRSTVAPTETTGQKQAANSRDRHSAERGTTKTVEKGRGPMNAYDKSNVNGRDGQLSMDSSIDGADDDDIMSILMKDKDKSTLSVNDRDRLDQIAQESPGEPNSNRVDKGIAAGSGADKPTDEDAIRQSLLGQKGGDEASGGEENKATNEPSLDEEASLDLLREYVAVDCEITLLEDKDALRIYHERIEQLEQLERELDMISAEAEEAAVARSENGSMTPALAPGQPNNKQQIELETDSITSAAGQSRRSRVTDRNQGLSSINNQQLVGSKKNGSVSSQMIGSRNLNNPAVEEVFKRKIILEKERDKLKKEVELVIVECDALQQKYKKRDDILDKLFDGRKGNGLENHLEQQLHWLLEQKHYVDQVFYAWKRAQTLTSQTCEQFANALELLKRLPKVHEPTQRRELVKSIESLLIKSLEDMEQAQKYNPNVDAPFFTDNETKRFDKIIETIADENLSQSDYSQILTVIQFVYKRAVSIRLWLEQILQTTIARDSFELAEEYKWIAIQLRKERINLIKSKLQSSPYKSMAHSIQEQVARKQTLADRRKQHEINRDSGIESETNDMDIEGEIYRLLELNKYRIEGNHEKRPAASVDGTNTNYSTKNRAHTNQLPPPSDKLRVANDTNMSSASSTESNQQHSKDRLMRDRIQKRVKGEQPLRLSEVPRPMMPTSDGLMSAGPSEASNMSVSAPTKLRIELDEEAKQSLLKQVDQIHTRHKSRVDKLRGSNRVKANSSIVFKMQQVHTAQQPPGS